MREKRLLAHQCAGRAGRGPKMARHYRAGACHVGQRHDFGHTWQGPAATPIAPQSLAPVKQAVRLCHGGFAKGIAAGLRLRRNHGDFRAESRFLRIKGLPAFVSEPKGNDWAER
jgi:hypothetical protein